jgi:hypothetical protein
MDIILSRIPTPADIAHWAQRHRGQLAGLFAGTIGTIVLTTFLFVAITGVPHGGARLDPDRTTVYPNF